MPMFIDTRGRTKLAIGICARCSQKFPYDELQPDPNYPGLYVCSDDIDELDPYRLAPRQTEDITLEHPRPDVGIATNASTPVPVPASGRNNGVLVTVPSSINPTAPWQASTVYAVGASVSPLNENNPSIQLPQYQFVATTAGTSGAVAPAWPAHAGVVVTDGTVKWLCLGIYIDDGVGTAFAAPKPSAT
jgi:hypothetical protein